MKVRKNTKTVSLITILVFLVITIFGGYLTVFGIGNEHKGKAEHIKLGLDLAGGVSVTYEVVDENPSDKDISDTVYKLQKRVEKYDSEAQVYREGSNRISVEIPGVTDANKVLEELGKPGTLSFFTEDGEEVLTGSDIKNAEAVSVVNNTTGIREYYVNLVLTASGTTKFADATTNNVGKVIYISYDGEIISAPTVNQAITGGEAQISGMSDMEDAENLASSIRIGALPLELKELRSNVVGAQLGEGAVSKSLLAGGIGIVLVIIFMIAVYRIPGFVASLALILYVILTLLCLNFFNLTLTLPGIAGIILTIGMAVDANVIIFTRIKEEIATGKTVKSSIKSGFDKALSAILDGNITTLIAAAVLYLKGSGTVKGFAQTLAIGIVLSMFTALVVTKQLLNATFALGIKDEKFYGRAKQSKVRNYVKFSKFCFVISIVVIAIGFIFMPINKSDKNIGNILNYSLEFKGGTSITIGLEDETPVTDEIVSEMASIVGEIANTTSVQTQTVKDNNQIVIKTVELTLDQRTELEDSLNDKYKVSEFETENISSSVSSEMRRDAIISVIIAAICMLIYIAFRFKDIKFAGSAVLALIHDVLVVLTVYSVFRLSVGNTFIACMLTIVGYSINATIIIFDRIRENLKVMNPKKDGLELIVNTSISQTFTRTINTSITTFVMVFMLWILGVSSIKEFSLTLMAGILCGAYSSICITGPLWFYTKTKLGNKEK